MNYYYGRVNCWKMFVLLVFAETPNQDIYNSADHLQTD